MYVYVIVIISRVDLFSGTIIVRVKGYVRDLEVEE